MTAKFRFDNMNDVIDRSKKVFLEVTEGSYTNVIAFQNVLIAILGGEMKDLATQKDDVAAFRVCAMATEALWGELYQTDSDSDACQQAATMFEVARSEAEDRWLTMTWVISMVRYSLEFGEFLTSKAAEDGNTNAMEHCVTAKENLAKFNAIVELFCANMG